MSVGELYTRSAKPCLLITPLAFQARRMLVNVHHKKQEKVTYLYIG